MLNIDCIPAFEDNYFWSIRDISSNQCVVVDPGDDAPVRNYLSEHNATLTGIIVTHDHHDHIGGIPALTRMFSVPVYGPASFPVCDSPVSPGDILECLDGKLGMNVLDTPGHKKIHFSYLYEKNLFCGDTLFSAGCGRIFDGSSKSLFESLTKLAKLPQDTMVYCAHEYTAANILFAIAVDPDNNALREYQTEVASARSVATPTIPTTIDRELKINPFLRTSDSAIWKQVEKYWDTTFHEEVDVFTALRRWKDDFR